MEAPIEKLVRGMPFVRARLDHSVGIVLEPQHHQRASASFGRSLRRVRSGTAGDPSDRIVEQPSERDPEGAFTVDLSIRGTPRRAPDPDEVRFVKEVSAVVDRDDVEHAVHRVRPGIVPAGAGERLTEELAASEHVVVVRDGT
ncbi:MAG: hypothetical protein RMK01_01420 [Thermomicrobium sp.]|nr:hypothetical protein [Thermomicrobium sp.]